MFDGKIKQEPRMEISDLVASLFFYFGYLMLLVIIHIMTINTSAETNAVLNTIFIILLYLYYALLIFGGVFLIIHFLKWMVWSIQTPHWLKEKIKAKRKQQLNLNH